MFGKHLFLLVALSVMTGCAQFNLAPIPDTETPSPADSALTLRQLTFDEVPGWDSEAHADVLPVLLRSCERIAKKDPAAPFGTDSRMGKVADWLAVCKDAKIIRPGNKIEAKYFFESRFVPYLAGNNLDSGGLFTGYYEPELRGSWGPTPLFQVPIYSRPTDIVSVDLGDHRPELAGTQIAGRVVDSRLVPYYTRAEINGGALSGKELEILWVDDPIDAFFLHIQGSGRILLPDGSHIRVGYAGRNGQRYTAIGRELVAMGQLKLENVTAPAIRNWLQAHPVAGTEVMNRNKSYVFFRVIKGEGPIGAQGAPLTPGRSLAVDPAFVPLGVPIWLNTTDPLTKGAPLRRLMVAQDTGSAIKGPVRGDVFWGFGAEAAARAGLMKQKGGYYLLLPTAAKPIPAS